MSFPDKIAVIDDRTHITFLQLTRNSRKMAAILEELSLKCGARVLATISNSVEYVLSFFSVNYIGGVWCPLSVSLKINQVVSYIRSLSPDAIITNKIIFVKELMATNYDGLVIYLDHDKLVAYKNLEIFAQYRIAEFHESTLRQVAPSGVAEILFSSGTTGAPKGVMLTVENIQSNIRGILNYLELQNTDIALIVKGMNHSSTLNGEILTTLSAGGMIITTEKLIEPNFVFSLIERYGVTIMFAVPSIISILLKGSLRREFNLRTIRIIHFYGSPISSRTVECAAQKFPHAELIYSYGLTEASPRVTFIKQKDLFLKRGSSGVPIVGTKVTIINDENILPPFQIGEIVVQGKNVMKGYYNEPELTNKVLTSHGLHTGDVGYLDEDGYLYVTGRYDEMIIINGINIYPAEIENVLMQNKSVTNAVVFAESSAGRTKLIAIVETSSINNALHKELYFLCNKELDPIRVPHNIIMVRNLQKTSSGKVIRERHLLERYYQTNGENMQS